MKYLTKDDQFGITRLARDLFEANMIRESYFNGITVDERWEPKDTFWVFFNQLLPTPWKQDKAALKRHKDEISNLIRKNTNIGKEAWVKKMGRITCVHLTREAVELIRQGKSELLTYEEIEKEKQAWQSHPAYRKEEGKSFPIEEEYVTLRIHTKGGE